MISWERGLAHLKIHSNDMMGKKSWTVALHHIIPNRVMLFMGKPGIFKSEVMKEVKGFCDENDVMIMEQWENFV